MTDFNLVTLPVIDEHDQLLGVITVDDALRTTIADDWWDRVEDIEGTTGPRHRPSDSYPGTND